MNGVINQLVFSLTGKENIWECTTEELQHLVNQYPYFGAANFLLAKKQETEASTVSIDYDSKASLYFQQPLWLDHLIHETGTKWPDMKQSIPAEATMMNEIVEQADHATETIGETNEEFANTSNYSSENNWQPSVIENTEEVIDENQQIDQPTEATPEPEEIETQNNYSSENNWQAAVIQAEPAIIEEFHGDLQPADQPIETVQEPEEQAVIDNNYSYNNNWQPEIQESKPDTIEVSTPVFENHTGDSSIEKDSVVTEYTNTVEEVTENPIAPIESGHRTERLNENNDDETDMPEQQFGNEPELKLPTFKIEPIDPSKSTLTFEPYHTIDYFASQGIRFKEEDKSKDKLTKQLKSFTEWLKVMKKLPESEIQSTVSATDEHRVSIMAQVSLSDREVVTEAMAEVWELQGNKDKAAHIYQKLSLLDPAKSAYFAAKIDHLKRL